MRTFEPFFVALVFVFLVVLTKVSSVMLTLTLLLNKLAQFVNAIHS
jgi:hypothetical protein